MRRPSGIAKLNAPRLFGVVPRHRLFALLDDNRGRPLIWLDSPPGAGKTSLVASYLEARKLPHLWYQIDPGDEDPATVFQYLTWAVQALPGAVAEVLPRFVAEHFADLPAFARIFFRELFARLPEGAVVVFDNYQELSERAPMHDILRTAVAQVPPGNSVLCVSRLEAPAAYAQLAANGRLAALHWDSLQLRIEETREISRTRAVTDDWLVRALHEQSAGWAAGITLMLERLGRDGGDTTALPTDTREATFDYFATLIFDQLPERTVRVLESVAYLPYVSTSMAAAVSEDDAAAEVLEQLYRRRMFTDRRPGPHPVYVFHALFRDFLRKRARDRLGAMGVHTLRLRSAQVLDDSQDVEAGIDLRVAAEDWTGVVKVLPRIAEELLRNGRRDTLTRWIDALPSTEVQSQPLLLYWLGIAHAQIAPAQGITTLQRALEAFENIGDVNGQIRCLTALLRFSYVGYFGVESLGPWLEMLLSKLPDIESATTSQDLEIEVWGVLCSTLMLARPSNALIDVAAERVEALLETISDPLVSLSAVTGALDLANTRGKFEFCDRLVDKVERYFGDAPASPSEAIWWRIQVAYLRFHQCRYEEALAGIDHAALIAERNGISANFLHLSMFRIMVEFRVFGWEIAEATLAKVESVGRMPTPILQAHLRLYQARLAQFRHKSNQAAELAMVAFQEIVQSKSLHHKMEWAPFCAEVLLEAGRVEDARKLLEMSREVLDRSLVMHDSHRAYQRLVEAYLAYCEGNRPAAIDCLRDALELAKEGERKYVLRFLETTMPPMFTLALENGIEVELVQQIIRMFRLKPRPDAPDLWPWPLRVHTLGRFEVLQDDKPLEFSRKVPRKTLALLKALIAYGGQEVPEQTLCDALWGDEEADAARASLRITVVRLRKLLERPEAIMQQGGKVSLNRSLCWVDAWRFEARATKASGVPSSVGTPTSAGVPVDAAASTMAGLDLYTGAFLPEDESEAWSVATRERLRGKFIHLLATQGAALETQGDLDTAIALYFRGIDADPVVEAFHQGLMRCYQRQGRHTEAISAFRRLRQTLSAVLGVAPSEASRRLFEDSTRECAGTHDIQNVLPMARPHR